MTCNHCGAEMDWEDCDGWCEDGFVDEHDDDPVNYAPGEEWSPCSRCNGRGGWWVCPTPPEDCPQIPGLT